MRLSIQRDGALARDLTFDANHMHEAAQQAVIETTNETHRAMRAQTAARLRGPRAGNLVARRFYPNRDQTVTGYIHSRWFVRDASGKKVDMLDRFEHGAVITAKNSRFLAIPLPEAGKTGLGVTGKRARLTPRAWERRTGLDLFPVRTSRGQMLLMARGGRLQGGRLTALRQRRGGKRTGPSTSLAGYQGAVPVFLLLPQVRLPKRLDYETNRRQAEVRLGEHFVLQLARRGL